MHMGDSKTSALLRSFVRLFEAEREHEVYPQYPGRAANAKMKETLAAVAVVSLVAGMLAVYFLSV